MMRCWCWDLERHQCESWAWLQARRGPDRSKRSLPLPLSLITISPVYPSRPSRWAFVENRPSNARIFVILPVYLWFWARSERYWGVWQTGQQRSERALNHKKTRKSPKPEFRPSLRPYFCPKNARLSPVFLQKWARLKNWEHWYRAHLAVR